MSTTTTSRTDDLTAKLAAKPADADKSQVAVRQPDRALALLESMEAEFAKCLPGILPIDMFMRVALTGFRKTPDLLLCTYKSLLGALLECARLGLAPCTEEASLAPFKNTNNNTHEVTLIIGYQGYVQLMYRSGQVSTVECEFVYAADEYEYTIGDGGRFWHKPNIEAEDRGDIKFAYSYAKLTGEGRTKVAITTRKEATALQKKYGRKPGSAWNSNFDGMWLKTPVRRVQKFAPKSPELRRAAVMDGASFDAAGMATTEYNGVVDPNTVDAEVLNVVTEEQTPSARNVALIEKISGLFVTAEIPTEAQPVYIAEKIGREATLEELTYVELAKLAHALESYIAQSEPPAEVSK